MSDSAARPLLDADAVSRAEQLGVCARFIVEGLMAGEHRSPYRGFATEFAQHREYAPGDDVRHLDWKALGRTDRQYIKQYEQETSFTAHLVVDASASMRYGAAGATKLDAARTMAACLAYLVLRQRDAIALRFAGGGETWDPSPDGGARLRLADALRRLAALEARGDVRVAPVLRRMASEIRRKGIVIVLSDFLDDEDEIVAAAKHLAFAGHETLAVQILHPDELEFPFDGVVEFEGLEPGAMVRARPVEMRESYLQELRAAKDRLRSGFAASRCHFLETSSAAPPADLLGRYLSFRKQTKLSAFGA